MSPAGSKHAPEAKAREKIDALLAEAGWLVQDRDDMNLTASDAIAVREFKLAKGHGYVDYLLFVDGNPVGVVEAKPAGTPSSASSIKPRSMSKDCRRRWRPRTRPCRSRTSRPAMRRSSSTPSIRNPVRVRCSRSTGRARFGNG